MMFYEGIFFVNTSQNEATHQGCFFRSGGDDRQSSRHTKPLAVCVWVSASCLFNSTSYPFYIANRSRVCYTEPGKAVI